jgi:hypothetical protein
MKGASQGVNVRTSNVNVRATLATPYPNSRLLTQPNPFLSNAGGSKANNPRYSHVLRSCQCGIQSHQAGWLVNTIIICRARLYSRTT